MSSFIFSEAVLRCGNWSDANGFRDYDPSSGRYNESDPNGLGGGVSTYAGVSSNPLSRVDADGLRDIFVGGAGDDTSAIVKGYYSAYHATHLDSAYYSWEELDAIVKDINNTKDDNPINLIGHSYVGDAAAAAALKNCGRVNLLITLDTVGRFHLRNMSEVRDSVKTWIDVGGSMLNGGNFIAGLGGAWNSRPFGYADLYVQDDL